MNWIAILTTAKKIAYGIYLGLSAVIVLATL